MAAAAPGRPSKARDEAVDWLRMVLIDGPVPAATLRAEAKAAGISWRTIERAREVLGVIVKQIGEAGGGHYWQWSLPAEEAP